MADYIYCNTSAESNFTVKNPIEVTSVFQELGFDETYCDNEETGKVFIGGYDQLLTEDDLYVVRNKNSHVVLGAYCTTNYSDMEDYISVEHEDKSDDIDMYEELDVWTYLQSQLVSDTDYVFITEAGHEKLRYCQGVAVLITKSSIKWFSLCSIMIEELKKQGISVR